MGGKGVNNVFIPQVTKRAGQKKIDLSNKLLEASQISDFRKLLSKSDTVALKSNYLKGASTPPDGELHGLKISQHAAKRFNERKIDINSEEFMRIKEGVDKLKAKGGQDSLVITNDGAYIVDVDNQVIVTAIDRRDMTENVFTKIDSTVFIN